MTAKRARINAMRLFLSLQDYDGKDRATNVSDPDPLIVGSGARRRSGIEPPPEVLLPFVIGDTAGTPD